MLGDLQELTVCDHFSNCPKRVEPYHAADISEERWRKFTYEEIVARDKAS